MPTFRPTVVAPATPASNPRRRLALALGAGIVVAFVVLLKTDPSPSDPAMGGSASSDAVTQNSSWQAAISTDFAANAQVSTGATHELPGRMPLAQLELAPNPDGYNAGFVIRAIAATGPLAEAGLRTGDILITIDGLPLDANRARRLADEFGGLDDVEVAYQRGSDLREALIVFRPR